MAVAGPELSLSLSMHKLILSVGPKLYWVGILILAFTPNSSLLSRGPGQAQQNPSQSTGGWETLPQAFGPK